MTEAPEEKWLAHNGGLPTGNYPKADLVRYIRADIHDAAVSAARKEGMREAAQIADRHYANGDMGNPGHHIMAAAETSP